MKKIFAAIGLLLLLQNAWAIDIGDAKDQGRSAKRFVISRRFTLLRVRKSGR